MALPTGIKRLALVTAGVPLVAAMATVMFVSPHRLGAQPAKAVLTVRASSDHVYSTLAHGLHVRKRPTTAATAVAVLGPAGTEVVVNCFALGSSVFGDSVWYHITKPLSGFVAGFYPAPPPGPAPGAPAFSARPPPHPRHPLAERLPVPAAPATAAPPHPRRPPHR